MEWCSETVTVFITLFCHHVKMTQVTASLKVKKMRGGPVKKMEWCPETVTVFITLFCHHVKMTQVTASQKVKKMRGGPGKKD
jgi:hypothetical protein